MDIFQLFFCCQFCCSCHLFVLIVICIFVYLDGVLGVELLRQRVGMCLALSLLLPNYFPERCMDLSGSIGLPGNFFKEVTFVSSSDLVLTF